MIINNFDESSYQQIQNGELSLEAKRSLFDRFIVDEDMDNNLQRDILGDLFFLAVMFCCDKGFGFNVTEILLTLLEEELLSMVNLTYDIKLPPTERIAILQSKMKSKLENSQAKPLKLTEWKSICDFVTTSFYRDLDSYYFMLTNIPSIVERNIDIVVDTPISNLPKLTSELQ